MNGSAPLAPCSHRRVFHATKSANVPLSHQSGTRRGLWPLVASPRRRRCGRETSTITSSSCNSAISETRNPQQQERRTMIRLRWLLSEWRALRAPSARTVVNSRRVRRRVWSRFQAGVECMAVLRGSRYVSRAAQLRPASHDCSTAPESKAREWILFAGSGFLSIFTDSPAGTTGGCTRRSMKRR